VLKLKSRNLSNLFFIAHTDILQILIMIYVRNGNWIIIYNVDKVDDMVGFLMQTLLIYLLCNINKNN
jgi:hypothetical protein